MEISAKQFRRLCEHAPEQTSRSVLKEMKGFGYTTLTLDEVKESMRKALANEDSTDIVVVWIKKYLADGISD